VKAVWNGAVVAECDETVVVEGNHYFPARSIESRYFEDSGTQTVCSWKGTASYKTLVVEGERNEDAAWYYPDPLAAVAEIRGHFAFWHGVEITE